MGARTLLSRALLRCVSRRTHGRPGALLSALLCTSLAGCLSLGGEPTVIRRHAIDALARPGAALPAAGAVSPATSLAVRPLAVLPRFERKVVRRDGAGGVEMLETERWVEDPGDAVHVALRERLRTAGPFSSVFDSGAAFRSDWVLEATLLTCCVAPSVAGTGDAAGLVPPDVARLELRVLVARDPGGEVVLDRLFRAEEHLAPDWSDLGPAMSRAVARVADDVATALAPVAGGR